MIKSYIEMQRLHGVGKAVEMGAKSRTTLSLSPVLQSESRRRSDQSEPSTENSCQEVNQSERRRLSG